MPRAKGPSGISFPDKADQPAFFKFKQIKCTNSSCDVWDPLECAKYRTKDGCRFGDTCSKIHTEDKTARASSRKRIQNQTRQQLKKAIRSIPGTISRLDPFCRNTEKHPDQKTERSVGGNYSRWVWKRPQSQCPCMNGEIQAGLISAKSVHERQHGKVPKNFTNSVFVTVQLFKDYPVVFIICWKTLRKSIPCKSDNFVPIVAPGATNDEIISESADGHLKQAEVWLRVTE